MNSSLLLWALPALPVIIHLIRLQVKKKYVFSSTAFLAKFLESQGWLTRLLRYLVLAMRVGFMGLLVYYLYNNFFVAETSRERITLFIDNSASALTRSKGKSILETHKTRAADLVLSLNPNSSISVITNNSSIRDLSPEEAAVEVASIRPYFQKPRLDRNTFSSGDKLLVFSDGGQKELEFIEAASQAIPIRAIIPELADDERNFTVDTSWIDEQGGRTFVVFQVTARSIKRLAVKVNEVIVAYQSVKDGANNFKVELRGNEHVAKIEVNAPDAGHNQFYATILNKPVRYLSKGVSNRYVSAFLTYNRLFARGNKDPEFEVLEWNGSDAIADFAGRNALVYPGQGVSAQAYASFLRRFGISTQPVKEQAGNEGFEMDPASSQALLSRILLRRENPTASYPFFRPLLDAQSAEEALAKTVNGYPIVVRRTINNRMVHFLTGPLGTNTNLQNSSLFAPILYQILVRKESSLLKYAWLDDDKTLMDNNLFSDSLYPGFAMTGGKDGIPIGLNVARSEAQSAGNKTIEALEKAGWQVQTGNRLLTNTDASGGVFPYLLLLGIILGAVEVVLLTRTFDANTPKTHPAGARVITQAS